MGCVSREMETLIKNQKDMLEIKNTVTEMKNAFDGLLSRVDTAEERISELEYISLETSLTERQRIKKKKKNRIAKNYGETIIKDIAYA